MITSRQVVAAILTIALTTHNLVGQVSTDGANASASGPDAVTIKQVTASTFVFIEHTGAYWSIGAQLPDVETYMKEHSESGPIFVRYVDNPALVASNSLRYQVGFLSRPGHVPHEPFKVERIGLQTLAYLRPQSASAATMRHFRALTKWVRDNGHQPIGPVYEVFFPRFDKDAQAATPTIHARRLPPLVELQMPIVTPPNLVFVPVGNQPRKENEKKRAVSRRQAFVEQASPVEHGDDHPDGDAHLPPTPTFTPTREIHQQSQAAVISPPVSTLAASVPSEGLPDASEQVAVTFEPPVPIYDNNTPIGELYSGGHFMAVAKRLMPDNRTVPTNSQVWFGQVVFRIEGIAKGLERMYPGQADLVTGFSKAISGRYGVIAEQFSADPLKQAVVRVDIDSDPQGLAKRRVLHDLDLMLGRIALRGVSVEDVGEQLAKTIQSVSGILEDLVRDVSGSDD